jgi:hypothetical protein
MKVLFFSPHSAVWTTAFPISLVAESLVKKGHEVRFLACSGIYKQFCMARAAFGVGYFDSSEKKEAICVTCRSQRDLMSTKMDLGTFTNIEKYLEKREEAEIRALCASILPGEYGSFFFLGVEVGKLSMYEFLIQNKKHTLVFSDKETQLYREIVTNACLSLQAFQKVFSLFKPEVCVSDNTLYSSLKVCQVYAEKHGVPTYFLCSNAASIAHIYESLISAEGDLNRLVKGGKAAWDVYKNVPLNKHEVEMAVDHLQALLQAKGHVYSSARSKTTISIRQRFGIRENQKILLATMSSYDELFAGEIAGYEESSSKLAFPTQFDWINSLCDFMSKRPELFLILRVHPREFMPSVHNQVSEHAIELQERLNNLPANVAVNWPKDKLSIYDFLDDVDVVLNAWSSAGLEMSAFGHAVVAYCPDLLLYSEKLNYCARTKQEYFGLIEEALEKGWDATRIRDTFRWYALLQSRCAIDLSDSYPYNLFKKKNFFLRLILRFGRIFNNSFSMWWDISRRKPILADIQRFERMLKEKKMDLIVYSLEEKRSEKEEEKWLRLGLQKLYEFLYNEEPPTSGRNTLQNKLWQALLRDELFTSRASR